MKTNKFTLSDYAKIAAVLLISHTRTNAQVIYTDLDPDIELLLDHETAGIDIDDNGLVDFVFLRTSGSYYTWYSGTELRFRQADWVLPYESTNGILGGPATPSNSWNNLVPPLNTSFLISSKMYFQNTSYQFMSFGFYKESGNWFYAFVFPVWNPLEGDNKYMGVKFIDSNDCFHYGWIRCEIEDSCKRLIIKDYAYELECDAPIAAGSMVSYVDVENENTFDGTVYSFDKTVYVKLNGESNNSLINIYDILGKEIYSGELLDQFTEIKLNNVIGIYLVEIIAETGRLSKKIYLN